MPCLLLLSPLKLADMPPIVDYPNHLARLFTLGHAGRDPVLDSLWRPRRAVIPDLGIDLVIPPLTWVTPPFAAGKVALASIPDRPTSKTGRIISTSSWC